MASTLNGSSAGMMPIALSCHSLSYICVCKCKTRMHDLFVAQTLCHVNIFELSYSKNNGLAFSLYNRIILFSGQQFLASICYGEQTVIIPL